QLFERNVQFLGEITKILSHHLARERVIASGNWSMGGEDIGSRYQLKCRIKIELLLHDIETNAFERQKRRMPFVHVKDCRLNAGSSERFAAADPKHDFLAYAHLKVAAVKLGSDQSVLGAVFRSIGVQEIETYSSHAQFPKPGKNLPIQNRYRNQWF